MSAETFWLISAAAVVTASTLASWAFVPAMVAAVSSITGSVCSVISLTDVGRLVQHPAELDQRHGQEPDEQHERDRRDQSRDVSDRHVLLLPTVGPIQPGPTLT